MILTVPPCNDIQISQKGDDEIMDGSSTIKKVLAVAEKVSAALALVIDIGSELYLEAAFASLDINMPTEP